MKWLLGAEAMLGSLLVAAVVHARGVRPSDEAVDLRIHLVFGSNRAAQQPGMIASVADGLAYMLRLFFVHVLGAELRPRRTLMPVTPPCDDCTQP